MRVAAAAFVFALAACSPPSSRTQTMAEPTAQDAAAAPSGADASNRGRVAAPGFRLAAEALVGRWSFDRSCGLYDLVFNADATANYYDYADERRVVSYAGRWAIAEQNRIVMSLRRLGETGAPTGEPLSYGFSVSDPVSDELIGQFGPAGGDMRAIAAKRCPEEDRK